ncbi:MAG: hypothetical protein HY644_10410 [Acidobacteria bacterium]|nr:hypothetical protein [Acidobacteriota bacterium]
MILNKGTVYVAAVVLVPLICNRAWAQGKLGTMASPLKLTAGECKTCHPRYYQEWKQSYHARSVVAMQTGFKKYIITQELAKRRVLNRDELMGCLGCHAPVMRFAADEDLARLVQLVETDQRDALAGLNVDCVACHTLVASNHPEAKSAGKLGRQVYYGTIKNPVSAPHGTQYAAKMEKSEFCKPCHSYVTPADMKVDADWDIVCALTYDAWAAGPYGPKAKKAHLRECQSCHMEKKDGKAAEVASATIPMRKVSSHLFPGWHDAAVLQRAVEIYVSSKRGTKIGTAELTVTIDNKAGHRFPDT